MSISTQPFMGPTPTYDLRPTYNSPFVNAPISQGTSPAAVTGRSGLNPTNVFPGGGGPLPTYQDLFAQNQNVYDLTLGQYGNAYRRLDETQQAIDQMQRNMYGTVMGTLDNAGAAAGQEITDQYAAQRGNAQQSLLSRGLGNTTVRDSVERGLTYDESKSRVNLANQIAAQRAGYQTHFADLGVEAAQRYAQQYGGIAQATAGYTGNYGNMLTQLANSNANNAANIAQGYVGMNMNAAQSAQNAQNAFQSQQMAAQNQMQQQLLQAQLQAALQQQQYMQQYGGGTGDFSYYG